MTEETRGTDRAGRPREATLDPCCKYETFLQLVRQEVTVIEAADHWQIGASSCASARARRKAPWSAVEIPAGTPGEGAGPRALAARTDAARLGDALKEMAVSLMLVEGRGAGDGWSGPTPG